MKKTRILPVVMGILICSTTAFALTMDPTGYADGSSPNGSSTSYISTWSRTNSGPSLSSAPPDLSGSGAHSGSSLLPAPNSDSLIHNTDSIPLESASSASGNAENLSAVKLSGYSAAPEQISLALVGAGLVALPFARRFRNKLQKSI